VKRISILITEHPDHWATEDVEDAINSALSSYFREWDYVITVQDVNE